MTGVESAVALVETLRLENAALQRNDFAAAGMLLERKETVARAFAEAVQREPGPALRDAARELADLAETNRRLLERGIAVQRQVIGLVARAAGAAEPGGRYNRRGLQLHAGGAAALISRA